MALIYELWPLIWPWSGSFADPFDGLVLTEPVLKTGWEISTMPFSFVFIDQLAAHPEPYRPPSKEDRQLFEAAMNEADLWHHEHNFLYAGLWKSKKRPVLPVGLFKHRDLSTPTPGPGMWLNSSGTGLAPAAKVFFDDPSLRRIEEAMRGIFQGQGFVSREPSKFLLLSPDPRRSPQPGYATAFLKFTACAPAAEIVFAITGDGRFEAALVKETLKRWGQEAGPVFLFGLTVFFERLALSLTEELVFKGPVCGLTGGGWKGLPKTLERPEIIARLQAGLKSPRLDIRDLFGLTEHPLHYVACPEGHFHLPVYSRFSIMGADGHELPAGQTGLIRLQNPFLASLPAHDILTEDLGLWGENCPCGSPLDYMKYLGRLRPSEGLCAQRALL